MIINTKEFLKLFVIPGIILTLFSCRQDLTIKESSFCKSLVPGKFILEAEEGWWNWCMAPIYDEEGKLHVFMSSIPDSASWLTASKIVHFTADSPEGPYQFVDTTFSSSAATYHNPQISKVGDTYVMVYLWKLRSTPGVNQQIGIATTKSLDGPWKESPFNPVIKDSGKETNGANRIHASNPTFLTDADGKFRIYYKSMTDKYVKKRYREISLAISDNIEDPYAFYYKGIYYMIVEDRMGVKNMLEGNLIPPNEIKAGGNRSGLIYKSTDGISWDRPELGYNTNTYYFGHELSRSERPHILWKDGKPECLFLANHGSREAGFFLRVNDWNE